MNKKILVTGHKSPDTDTICSAIAAAYLAEQCGKPSEAVCAGQPNKETKFALEYFHVDSPRLVGSVAAGQPLILVDHNESKQALDGMAQADVIALIDHHRLGDFETEKPIYIRVEPVGCTATILFDLFQERGVQLPKEIAGMLLSAIISDTVLFRSPTCTDRDKEAVYRLAELAGVSYEEYGMAMLKAGADVSDLTPMQMVQTDRKEFSTRSGSMSIGQLSVMDTETVLGQRDELLRILEEDRREKGYIGSFLMVTDILNESTELLFAGEIAAQVTAAFQAEVRAGGVFLPGVMSRKKQIVPPLLSVL